MQDYPQHLFQAYAISCRNNPAFDFDENFNIDFRLAPYATFYAITVALSAAMPIEVAGKVSVSLYILCVILLVTKLSRRFEAGFVPWGLLLLFPLAFNQNYFLGNINYVYSLPLLLFTLIDHEHITRGPVSIWPVCRHALWQLSLFLTHPFTFLMYVSLAGVGALLSWPRRSELVRGLIFPVAGAVFFLLWFATTHAGEVVEKILWCPFTWTLSWYGSIFTGMRWWDGLDKVPILVWMAIGVLVVHTFLATEKVDRRFSIRYALFFTVTTVAVFILPFGIWPSYMYVNLRVAAAAYLFLAMLVGQLRFKGIWKGVFTVLVTVLLIHSVIKQGRISVEIEEIVPIVSRIPKNSRILPLVFDNDTPELDPSTFDIHLHDHNYYHVLVGGGLSPYLFVKTPLLPVYHKPGVNRPAPGLYSPHLFRWERHASDYHYFLARGAPGGLVSYLTNKAEPIARSGKWILFKRTTDPTKLGNEA
jgi:hypothetical protein